MNRVDGGLHPGCDVAQPMHIGGRLSPPHISTVYSDAPVVTDSAFPVEGHAAGCVSLMGITARTIAR
jgi:hypothetical protein